MSLFTKNQIKIKNNVKKVHFFCSLWYDKEEF